MDLPTQCLQCLHEGQIRLFDTTESAAALLDTLKLGDFLISNVTTDNGEGQVAYVHWAPTEQCALFCDHHMDSVRLWVLI